MDLTVGQFRNPARGIYPPATFIRPDHRRTDDPGLELADLAPATVASFAVAGAASAGNPYAAAVFTLAGPLLELLARRGINRVSRVPM